jgi:hypothetical protein
MAYIDLDTLLSRVKSHYSKRYAEEAIRSYRAGALRAATTSIWVAVQYDIVSKIRELAENGDKEAKAFADSIDKAINNQSDIDSVKKQQLDLEKKLLEKAHEIQLINLSEKRALMRIQEDRHWCAHPFFMPDNTLF